MYFTYVGIGGTITSQGLCQGDSIVFIFFCTHRTGGAGNRVNRKRTGNEQQSEVNQKANQTVNEKANTHTANSKQQTVNEKANAHTQQS